MTPGGTWSKADWTTRSVLRMFGLGGNTGRQASRASARSGLFRVVIEPPRRVLHGLSICCSRMLRGPHVSFQGRDAPCRRSRRRLAHDRLLRLRQNEASDPPTMDRPVPPTLGIGSLRIRSRETDLPPLKSPM